MFRLSIVLMATFFVPAAGFAQLGDRLIIAINDSPYTQRQIETHISVKESLRKGDQVRLIRPDDWASAVDVFTEDMIIFQESLRLGSFEPADQLVDRFVGAVQERLAADKGFAANIKRLGVNERELRGALEAVLRIESFRKSKDRQDELAGQVRSTVDEGKESWFADLEQRAVIRLFKDAKIYKKIEPTG